MSYIPNTDADREAMLKICKAASVEELFCDVPKTLRNPQIDLPQALCEMDLARELRLLSGSNKPVSRKPSFLGAGAYNHYIPSVVKHIVSRSEFYTAYTPYQPEISQGILQAVYEYQTMICRLTGMDAANASMYDASTAMAEAALLASSYTKKKEVVVSSAVNPFYRRVLSAYAAGSGLMLKEVPFQDGITDLSAAKKIIGENTACVIVQQPNFFGCLEEVFDLSKVAHDKGALFVACADPVSLAVLNSPSEYGADIVVGEGQPLGNPLNFGGPYLGIFAVKKQYLRYMPGRVVGKTQDSSGMPGYVLTLQTREQHIRREKATSNICSNEALCALAACVYLTSKGDGGLLDVAQACHNKGEDLKRRITSIKGFSLAFDRPFFREFAVRLPKPARKINELLSEKGIIGGLPLEDLYPGLKDHMLFCVTEMNTEEELEMLCSALKNV